MKTDEARDFIRKVLEIGAASVPIAASYFLSAALAKQVAGGSASLPTDLDLLSEIKGARSYLRASLAKRGT